MRNLVDPEWSVASQLYVDHKVDRSRGISAGVRDAARITAAMPTSPERALAARLARQAVLLRRLGGTVTP